jgi:hydrogenase maturation protease
LATAGRRILVAGMGNLLRGDGGFGIEVIRRLRERGDLPACVRAVDVGVAEIALVHELLDGYELLIIVNAVCGGRPPGTLVTLNPQVPDQRGLPAPGTAPGDPHPRKPARILGLAAALGVLPDETVIVGCEAEPHDEPRLTLSEPVAVAVDQAAERVTALARSWLSTHDAAPSPPGPSADPA